MDTETGQHPPPTSPRRDRDAASAWRRVEHRAAVVTRLLGAVAAALTLAQGALAGSYLVGDGGALVAHQQLGTDVLTIVGLLVGLAALVVVRVQPWRAGLAVLGFLALLWQIDLGFADQLDLHVPVGVAIFGCYLILAVRPAPALRA